MSAGWTEPPGTRYGIRTGSGCTRFPFRPYYHRAGTARAPREREDTI